MNKQVFVINGSGGVGKDTFVNMIRTNLMQRGLRAINHSSVDEIKCIAKLLGWNGVSKTDKDRKFLSDLKALSVEYNDFPFKCMTKEYIDFINDHTAVALFLHIREPEEIDKAKDLFNAKTILITRDSLEQITSNASDKNVYNYDYDYVISNNSDLTELNKRARFFIEDIIMEE